MYRFFLTLLGMHGKKAMRDVIDATVEMDVDTASAAQLVEMERDLDNASKLFAKLKVEAEREEREAREAEKLYDLNLAAAEEIQARMGRASDEQQRATLENSLNALVTRLEELNEAAKTERAEALEATALLNEAEEAYKEKAAAILEAKKTLDKGKQGLQRAKIQAERAEARAERAAEVAGLREGGGTNLNAAVKALERQTAEAKQRAEAAALKASNLKKPTDVVDSDAVVQDALRAVSGRGASTALPASERLARLTGRTEPALSLPAPSTENTNHA